VIDIEKLIELRRAAKAAKTPPVSTFDGRRLVALARGDGRSCTELASLAGLPEAEVRRLIDAELALEAADRRERVSSKSRESCPRSPTFCPPTTDRRAAGRPRPGAFVLPAATQSAAAPGRRVAGRVFDQP